MVSDSRPRVPRLLVATLAAGTLLNPLNSSMIAVALVQLQDAFSIGVGTVTWLISGFYVAAAVGQPLMGRLVDQFGARRLFMAGLVLVLLTSAAMPFVPNFWWLVALRAVQALGTSTAYPAALVLIRAATPGKDAPAGAMGILAMAGSTSAALGPVIGGVLVSLAGWQAVFLVNVPFTLVGLLLASRTLPRTTPDRADTGPRFRGLLAEIDLPGIALFTMTLVSVLLFLLSFSTEPRWWCLPIFLLGLVALIIRERAVPTPFLDVRGLAANPALTSVLVQQATIQLVFYCAFFSLPMWLESVQEFETAAAGAFVLPIAGLGVLTIPLAARLIDRRGSRAALVLGSVVLLTATIGMQVLDDATPILVIVGFMVLFGIPNGFNNLGLQTALYTATPASRTGSSGGLFQTFRYLGAISATAVIGMIFENDLTSAGLHRLGLVMSAGAIVVLVLALTIRRHRVDA